MRLRVGAGTNTGRVRDLNEDVYMVQADQGLFVVCDGMGGAPAGEVASQIAADTIVNQLNADDQDDAAAAHDHAGAYLQHTSRLAAAIRRSNQVVFLQAQQNPGQAEMGTTVVGAWIKHQIASVAHVGDSRAYLWHNHHLEQLTRDHSLVEAHAEAGITARGSIDRLHQQNILLRAVGCEPDVDVDVNEVPLQAGDYLLLCSDGLTRMVSDAAISEAILTVQHPQRICDFLIEAANRNGGADNITVVVVEVKGSWWRRLSNRWKRDAPGDHDAKAHPRV